MRSLGGYVSYMQQNCTLRQTMPSKKKKKQRGTVFISATIPTMANITKEFRQKVTITELTEEGKLFTTFEAPCRLYHLSSFSSESIIELLGLRR